MDPWWLLNYRRSSIRAGVRHICETEQASRKHEDTRFGRWPIGIVALVSRYEAHEANGDEQDDAANDRDERSQPCTEDEVRKPGS